MAKYYKTGPTAAVTVDDLTTMRTAVTGGFTVDGVPVTDEQAEAAIAAGFVVAVEVTPGAELELTDRAGALAVVLGNADDDDEGPAITPRIG